MMLERIEMLLLLQPLLMLLLKILMSTCMPMARITTHPSVHLLVLLTLAVHTYKHTYVVKAVTALH